MHGNAVQDRAHAVLRMPKCSTRPYGPPGNILLCRSGGRKLGSPSGVVLLDSARSAEPPHNSGSLGAIAVSTSPDALRVAMPWRRRGTWAALHQLGELAGLQPLVQRMGLRIGRGPLVIARLPGLLGCVAALRNLRVCSRTSSDTSKPVVGSPRSSWSPRPPRRRARRRAAGGLQLRSGPADDRAEANEAGLVGHCPRRIQRFCEGGDVLGVRAVAIGPVDVLDMPAVRGITRPCPRSARYWCRPRSRWLES